MSRILGVDPGITGGLCLLDTDAWTIAVLDMPQEVGKAGRKGVSPTLTAQAIAAADADYSFVEDVWSSPQAGVASSFSFGRSLGIVLGAASASSSLTPVKPTVWKAALQVPRDKNQARARAVALFPSAASLFARVKDDGRAEAALIALWGALSLKLTPPKPLTLAPWPAA
ncbi:MAG: hypothetical protein ACK4JY_03920 [Brevundimonas sp.]|uniref:hypothetical protein n=1 Tax=Brevundimonas sp. TaxID=1871086 RepID=UPI00391B03ED